MEDILKELEELNSKNNYWIIVPETARFLRILLNIIRPKYMLEAGTSIGYSGICAGMELRKWGGKLVTVESNLERFELAKAHFKKAGLTDVIIQVKGHAPEIFSEIKQTFDFVFLDATKHETLEIFKQAQGALNKNVVIVVDNVISHAEDMENFLKFMKKQKEFLWEILEVGQGVGMGTRW